MAYTALVPFQNGLKWGFKDLAGNTSIKPVYDMASPFKNGISVVVKDGKAGLLAASGDYILEPVYDSIEPRDDLAMYLFRENGKTGMLSYSGEMLSPALFDEVGELSEGLFPALKENCWGFYNGRMQEVIPSIYTSAKKFRYGVAEVTDLMGFTRLIDRQNNFVEAAGMVYSDEEHLSRYSPDDLDILDVSRLHYGKYRELSMASGGGKLLSTPDYKLLTGKIYEEYHACGDGYFITGAWPGAKYPPSNECMRFGVINTRGDQILPLIFEKLQYLGSGAFAFRLNSKWGVINNKLEVLVEPNFNYPHSLESGLVVRRDRASHIVNTRGDSPVRVQVEAEMLQTGFEFVRFDGEAAYYDKNHDVDPEFWVHRFFEPGAETRSGSKPEREHLRPLEGFSHGLISKAALHETAPETFGIDDDMNERVDSDGPVFFLEELYRPEVWMLPDGDKFSFSRAFDHELERIERFSSSSPDEKYLVDIAREIIDPDHGFCNCGPDEPLDPDTPEASLFGEEDEDGLGDDFDEEEDARFEQFLREKAEEAEAEMNENPRQEESTVTFRGAGMLLDIEGDPSAITCEPKLEKWGEGVFFSFESGESFSNATIRNNNFEVILPGLHPVENDRYTTGKYFRVTLAGKYGLIDREGRLVIDPVFNTISRFIKGAAFALTDDAAVVISMHLDCRYLQIEAVNFSSFDGETIALAVDGSRGVKWGLIDTSGAVILPYEYDLLRRVSAGHLIARRGNLFGIIDNCGKEVLPFRYAGYSAPVGNYLPLINNTGYYTLFNIRTGKLAESFKLGRHRHHLNISGIKPLPWGYCLLRLENGITYINPAVPPRETRIMATPPPDLDGLI